MTTLESRPAKAAIPVTRNSPSVPQSADYPSKIRLSESAELSLDRLGSDLLLDNVELWQLPRALLQFWEFAFEAGRSVSRQDEIDRLRWERDLWYFVASNKVKRPGDYYTHLTDTLWAEASR